MWEHKLNVEFVMHTYREYIIHMLGGNYIYTEEGKGIVTLRRAETAAKRLSFAALHNHTLLL